jgi:hypothetical protein
VLKTARDVGRTDAQTIRLLEKLFVIEEKIMLTSLVKQQAHTRTWSFSARGQVYVSIIDLCKVRLAKLEEQRALILAQLE